MRAAGREDDGGGDARTTLLLAFIVVFFFVLIPAVARLFYGMPSIFAVVEGKSMEPVLHTGDLVLMVPRQPDEIRVGDVVVYAKYGGYIIHRVVHVYQNDGKYCYVLWGDNRVTNRYPDAGFPETCGRVTFTDPYTGVRVTASGVPYEAIVGVVASFNGYSIKLPFFGVLTLLFR